MGPSRQGTGPRPGAGSGTDVSESFNSWQLEDHLHDEHLITSGQLDEMDSQKMRSVHAAEHYLDEADHKHEPVISHG